MIRSMTGFGRGLYENDGREYVVEIKSVNHRYNDINIKLPKSLNEIEYKLKSKIDSRISRGKLEVYVDFRDNKSNEKSISFNKELAKFYVEHLRDLAEEANIKCDLNVIDISKMPEVFKREDENDANQIFEEMKIALNEALDKIIQMKEFEGNKLKIDIENRLKIITDKINEISKFSAGLVEEYIVKLETRIKELLKTDVVDETRLAQEIVIFSDKSSIEEELTRLKSHINQFEDLLKTSSPIGKKLDFLIQEMNREANTIGSKANSLNITNLVVDLKTEIENIREQIQNIE